MYTRKKIDRYQNYFDELKYLKDDNHPTVDILKRIKKLEEAIISINQDFDDLSEADFLEKYPEL